VAGLFFVNDDYIYASERGRILNIPVPQTGHDPFMAGRVPPPFFLISVFSSFAIVRFALHFTQYPSVGIEKGELKLIK